jgi:hypothetical protein
MQIHQRHIDKMSRRTYAITCLMLWFLTSYCQRKGEDAVYLIPKNFEGNLFIVFGQEKGTDTVYEEGMRIYNFDTTGILRTKFKPHYGLQQNFYFYVDSVGNKTPLRYLLPSQIKGSDEVVAYNQETGKNFDKAKSVDRHFEMITIAKQKNISAIGNERSSLMWNEIEQ